MVYTLQQKAATKSMRALHRSPVMDTNIDLHDGADAGVARIG